MSKYKLIQLTNKAIGEVDVNSYLPLGLVTRRINADAATNPTFQVGTTGADAIYINDPGHYKVTYSASLIAGATGILSVSLISNQQTLYTVSETIAAAEDAVDIDLTYVIRICPNCCGAPLNCPAVIQLQLGGVATSATTLSTSNLIIEKLA
jgi:hypothetical protein